MVFYLLSVVILLCTIACKKNKRKLAWLSFACFTIIYVFLRNIGTDWIEYSKYYNKHNGLDFFDGFFEPGFSAILALFKFFEIPYSVVAGVIALFVCCIYFRATNKYTECFGFVAFLASFYIFYPGLESIRQLVTVVLFYYSLQYIDNDWKKYFLLNMMGVLFHRTGVFTLFFYFFHRYEFIKIGYFAMLPFYSIFEPYIYKALEWFPSIYQKYYWYRMVYGDRKVSVFSFKLLEYIFLACVAIFIRKNRSTHVKAVGNLQKENLTRENVTKYSDLVFIGIGLQLFIQPIFGSTYRILYYSDIGIVMTFCCLYENLQKRYMILAEITMAMYIVFRFYRLLSVNTQLFA